MDEEIVEEERSADEAGEHGNAVVVDVDDPWVKYMEAKLALKSKHWKPSHPFTICRVPRDIRSVDNVAHDPLMVSIGPYHRRNPSLHEMEEVKWLNLNKIRDRAGNNFKDYLKEMRKIEPEARACYSGNINMEADEFIEMMLLDGLFMIELFSTRGNSFLSLLLRLINNEKEEPIYTIGGMLCRVGHDMLLLENQLPFFVLECLWNLTNQGSRPDLCESACTFIVDYSLLFEHAWDSSDLRRVIFDEEEEEKGENPEMINEDCVHHLLHLVHSRLTPTSTGSGFESMEPTDRKPPTVINKMKTLSFLCRDCFRSPSGQESQCTAKLHAVIKKIFPFISPSMSKVEQTPPLMVIPSAVELEEAGVEFQCVHAKSFLYVKFEKGTMKMPRLSVHDSTKSLLRNFVAYEQCFPHPQGNHITSYCSFMARLVKTQRDVEILKKSKIIENELGSDEEVALLFNDLRKGIFLSGLQCGYLGESLEQVTKHKPKHWPKWLAKLNQDYFSSPWTIISLIAATFVIFLTSVQTYYAAFT